jgi:hypothetical protein
MDNHGFASIRTAGGSQMKRLFGLTVLGLSLGLSGCNKLEQVPLPKVGSGEAKQEPQAVVGGGESVAKKDRDEFVAAMEKDLGELRAKIADLKMEVKKASGKARTTLEQQITALEEEAKSAEQKLADIKSATLEKWRALQQGMKSTFDHLKQSVQKATSAH